MNKYLFILLFVSASAWAQGPNGTERYYRPANGKCGAELKTAFSEIIRNPKVVGYDNLKAAYQLTDVRPDGYLRDWYSNATEYVPGTNCLSSSKEEGKGYNREHLLCQSWFGSGVDPMRSDIMHVVPVDCRLNNKRNDNPLGEVTDQTAQVSTSLNGYSKWGAPNKSLNVPEGLKTVFEPNDEIKGDIARIYFYMITCYEDTLHTWPWRNSDTAIFVFDEEGTPYEPLQPWVMDMFMRWSENDPVDSVELARNEAVWRVQGNRNPYVDYPGLENYIWGELKEEPFVYGDGTDDNDPLFQPTMTIALNSAFFGGEWTGVRPARASSVVRGEENGVTIEFALGKNENGNMYLGKDHIRMYQKNLLEFSTTDAVFDKIDFEVTKNDNGRVLMVGEDTLQNYNWTGSTPTVTFHLDEDNGPFYIKSVTIHRTRVKKVGDVNVDFVVDVADIAAIIDYMAAGEGPAEADVNGDGAIDVADVATVIDIMATGQ